MQNEGQNLEQKQEQKWNSNTEARWERENYQRFLKTIVIITAFAFLLVLIVCNNRQIFKLESRQNVLRAAVTQMTQNYAELDARINAIGNRMEDTLPITPDVAPTPGPATVPDEVSEDPKSSKSPVKDVETPTDQENTVAPASQTDLVASDSAYEITYEKYVTLAPEVRIMLLKEHFRSASLAIKYFISALTETNSADFLRSEAGTTVARLYSVWSAIEKDSVALQAVDILITQEKFFGRTFTEAAEVGGMAVLMEALSHTEETDETAITDAPTSHTVTSSPSDSEPAESSETTVKN